MRCPNKAHPDWKELVRKVGVNDAYQLYFSNNYEIPNIEDVKDSIKGINAGLKILEAITSDKGQQLFRRFFGGNKPKFFQEISQLAGAQQSELLSQAVIENNLTSFEDVLTYITSEMSYVAEFEIAKNQESRGSGRFLNFDYEGARYRERYNDNFQVEYTREGQGIEEIISREEYEAAQSGLEQEYQDRGINSDFYSRMVARGGTNYEEINLNFPGIEPSRLTHNSFGRTDTVGWFRSDSVEGNPIRRVLEMQSDLFQKKTETGNLSENENHNRFLNLLKNKNNWVSFFIRSFIQDSILKGFTRVRFPSGNTVSEIQHFYDTSEETEQYIRELRELRQKLRDATDAETRENIESDIEYKERDLKFAINSAPREDNAIIRFYTDSLHNTLKKMYGNRMSQITDSYGNTWNEIELEQNSDGNEFYYQQSSLNEGEIESETRNAIKNFFEKNGFSLESVNEIIDPSTEERINANAVVDLTSKVIRVIEGKEKADTLPEEAGHVIVAMLGNNHPLVRSMMNEVEQYDIYQQVVEEYGEVYNNDTTKLKKEAVGKIIAKKMLGETLDKVEANESRLSRWWNRVLKAINNIVASLKGRQEFENRIVQADPFSQAAQMILNEDTIDYENIEGEVYYQLSQEEIVDSLRNKHKLTKDNEGYKVHKDGQEKRVKKRVTDRTKKFLTQVFGEESISKFAEIAAEWGTKGHSDIENIVNRAIAKRNGEPIPAKVVNTREGIYNILEKYFLSFIENIPVSSKILTEVQIFDPKNNEAGTIDFLVIHEDGSASIYDWKFMNFGKMKEVKWYKKEIFNRQIDGYRSILHKEYGIESFREMRVIPIEAVYKGEELEGIKVGDENIEDITSEREHLQPVPILEERTGNEALDKIITKLVFDKRKLDSQRAPTSLPDSEKRAWYATKAVKLKQITDAIRDIQLRHDLTEFTKIGRQLNDALEHSDLSEYSDSELVEMLNEKLNFYSKDLIQMLATNLGEKFNDIFEDLSKLTGGAGINAARVKDEIERRVRESNPEMLTPQKNIGWWGKYFRRFSEQDNPIISAFADLIRRSNHSIREEFDVLNEKVRETRLALQEKGINNYDWMLTKLENGLRKIIPKTSQEFREKLNESREILNSGNSSKADIERAKQFILNNYEFDKEKYEKDFKTFKDNLEERKVKEGIPDDLFASETAKYVDKYSNNARALGNRFNDNLKLKERPEIFSKEYNDILADPAKKAFYDLYTEYSTKYQSYIGKNKDTNFVWNVPVSLTEGVIENGFSHIAIKEAWINYYKAQEYEYFAHTDENGQIELQVPKMFDRVQSIENEDGSISYDTRLQSTDLGQVLLTVSGMAMNHKNMLDIEGNAALLKHLMANSEIYTTGRLGELVKDEVTGKIKTNINNSNNQDTLRQFIEYYMYGRKIQHSDKKIFGLSAIALTKSGMNYFRTKALSFNTLSAAAGFVDAQTSATMLGASNRYYTVGDFYGSLKDLTTANEKAHSIRKFMNIEEGENYQIRSAKQSMSSLKKLLNSEHLHVMLRYADWPMKQGVMLAMMKHWKVVDGKIINKNKAPKDAPSLYDTISIENGEIDFNVSSEELNKFRDKVNNTINSVVGMSGMERDVRAIDMNLFGQMLTMFRGWLPRNFDVRFGTLKENRVMEEAEMGRYRSFINNIIQGVKDENGQYTFPGVLKTAGDLITGFGTFGFSEGSRRNAVEYAKVLYAEARVKDPSITITEEQYIDMHLANLRASMVELYIMLGITAMVALAMPDDDEKISDLSGGRRFVLNSLQKFQTELLTYINPVEFENLIKRPVPAIRMFLDINNLFKANVMYGGELMGIAEESRKKNAVRKAWFSVFPILSGIETMIQYVDEDYNEMISVDQRKAMSRR